LRQDCALAKTVASKLHQGGEQVTRTIVEIEIRLEQEIPVNRPFKDLRQPVGECVFVDGKRCRRSARK
jgi:hypothetical protein